MCNPFRVCDPDDCCIRSEDGRLGQMGEQVRRRRFAAHNREWLQAASQVKPAMRTSPSVFAFNFYEKQLQATKIAYVAGEPRREG